MGRSRLPDVLACSFHSWCPGPPHLTLALRACPNSCFLIDSWIQAVQSLDLERPEQKVGRYFWRLCELSVCVGEGTKQQGRRQPLTQRDQTATQRSRLREGEGCQGSVKEIQVECSKLPALPAST